MTRSSMVHLWGAVGAMGKGRRKGNIEEGRKEEGEGRMGESVERLYYKYSGYI